MQQSLAHLPEIRQKEILEITEIIKEKMMPEKIILFGSHARGGQVLHKFRTKDGTIQEYMSDYDFLVVTKTSADNVYKEESIIVNLANRNKLPVNLEIHEIDYINKGLELGEYFFVEIIKEGITLYDTGNLQFVEPRELTPEERREKAQRYFNTWFPQAKEFIIDSRNALNRKSLKNGIFYLHQATESLYYTVLLVFTDYKPKVHNLWKLRKKAKPYSEELFLMFPAEIDREEERLFDLLKRGYIDARYRTDYEITVEELTILIEKVATMVPIVERICKEKIAVYV